MVIISCSLYLSYSTGDFPPKYCLPVTYITSLACNVFCLLFLQLFFVIVLLFAPPARQICNANDRYRGADASAEGVQRDLLPMIEGSTISTKHGNVKTDFVLFIASGAFHTCKPSDLLAELQVTSSTILHYTLRARSSDHFF